MFFTAILGLGGLIFSWNYSGSWANQQKLDNPFEAFFNCTLMAGIVGISTIFAACSMFCCINKMRFRII